VNLAARHQSVPWVPQGASRDLAWSILEGGGARESSEGQQFLTVAHAPLQTHMTPWPAPQATSIPVSPSLINSLRFRSLDSTHPRLE
jgi:hypothetical protein